MANHMNAKKHKSKQKILNLIFIIVFIVGAVGLIFALKNYFPKAKTEILGVWDYDGNTKYKFEKNNVGYLKVPMKEYKFNYFLEENNIRIDFENEDSKDAVYKYEIKGDVLTLKKENTILTFNKEKE